MELYPHQIKVKDLINSTKDNIVVTTPTGSGKTKCAEFAILKALETGSRLIYTTPLKALSNQKYKDFRETYGVSRVGLVTGDYTINKHAQIIVATAEVLRNTLLNESDFVDNVSYVVLDEFHYIADTVRGTVWEEILLLAPKNITFICLSATFANGEEVCKWMSSIHKNTQLVNNTFRPVPLTYYYYNNKNLRVIKDGRSISECNVEFNINSFLKSLDENKMLPCIFFTFNRELCHELADKVDITLLTSEQRQLMQTEISNFTQLYPFFRLSSVGRLLLRGIGIHHAGMLPHVKSFIEKLYLKGLVKVVFATETLSAGINMPAKTTIISSVEKFDGVEKRNLTISEFKQLAGRAGRKGYDDFGNVVILGNDKHLSSLVTGYLTSDPDKVRSILNLNYTGIVNLLASGGKPLLNRVVENCFISYIEKNSNNENYCSKISDNRFKKFLNYVDILYKLDEKLKHGIIDNKEYNRKLAATKKKLKNYSCGKCPNVEDHREYMQMKNTLKESNKVIENITNRIEVLKRYKYLHEYTLTGNGFLLSLINDTNELFTLELLLSGILDNLGYRELVCLLSCISSDRKNKRETIKKVKDKNKADIKENLTATRKLIEEINSIESIHGIEPSLDINKTYVTLVDEWVCGATWKDLYSKGMDETNEGEVFRVIHRIINVLKQYKKIEHIPDNLKSEIDNALSYMERDIIKEVF